MVENVFDNRSLEEEIFFPYSCQKQKEVFDNQRRFVHYTSAEAAMSIIKNEEMWMRKSTCMNDYSEVKFGINRLYSAWDRDSGMAFRDAIDSIFPNISNIIAKDFDEWQPAFIWDTYLTCFSEHEDDEDNIGRLSMWRAYGGNASVAFVLKNDVFFSRTDALAAYVSPVAYIEQDEFSSRLFEIADNIKANVKYLKSRGKENMKNWCFSMLRYAALCSKHPGFKEEREWRLIYSPSENNSKIITKNIETINGIVQPICKVPLKDKPEKKLDNLQLSKSLDRIIIGPCEFPEAMSESFVALLNGIGVERPKDKVITSDIPLRH